MRPPPRVGALHPISHVTAPTFACRSFPSLACSPSHVSLSRSALLRQQTRRYASTEAGAPTVGSRLRNLAVGATLLLGFGVIFVYVTDTRSSIHKYVIVPGLRTAYRDPEEAHHVGNNALKRLWEMGMHPRERGNPDLNQDLTIEVFGHTLLNPIGTSAGIDKHADIPDPLFAIGPAIIEIGGTTPLPQDGNDKPRVFRLSSQNALINRYGLNSEGADHVAMRLRRRVRAFAYSLGYGYDADAERRVLDGGAGVPPGSLNAGKLLAVNIATNKTTPKEDVEAVTNDYVYCVDRLAPYADILVVNVSSPNTPGLRTLQQTEPLKKILTGVVDAARSVDRKIKPAVMVKVSPDEDSDEQVAGICEAVWASGVDGVIVGNTTNRRPQPLPHLQNLTPLEEQHLLETGGFSGPHLFERTVALVKKYRQLLNERPASTETPSRPKGSLEAEADRIKASIKASTAVAPTENPNDVVASIDTGVIPFKDMSEKEESEKQPLFKLPTDRFYDQSKSEQDSLKSNNDSSEVERHRLRSIQDALEKLPPKAERNVSNDRPKVIFATGGITNGKQALEVLNAGASVAMVYTALVYGGAGTISRIKDEMRAEIKGQKGQKRKKSRS